MWKFILAYPPLKVRTLSTAISDQEERETDGAVHWDTINPTLLRACGHQGARDLSEKNWLQHIYDEGSNKTRFEYCVKSKNSLMYIRAPPLSSRPLLAINDLCAHKMLVPCPQLLFVVNARREPRVERCHSVIQ